MPAGWFGLLLIGLFAGVMAGMFGIGGGVIIVPALILFTPLLMDTPLNEVQAIATSSGALLLPVGIFAAIAYHRKGLMRVRESALIGMGLFLTSAIGASITISLEKETLKTLYGIFLFVIGWRYGQPIQLFWAWRAKRTGAEIEKKPDHSTLTPDTSIWIVSLIGLIAGVFSGMFGIGGGAVIVPALTAFLLYDQKLAVGTSLGALLLPVGLPSVLVYYGDGSLNLGVAMVVAVGLLFGAIVGSRIALGLPSATVKQMYGFFLLFVALRFIFG